MESFNVFQIPQGKHSKRFVFIDMIDTGRPWSFRCSTRKKDVYPKPVFSSGWIKYVRRKGLREGDQVSFFFVEKDGEEGLRFGVQAQKKLRLLGKDCWTTPFWRRRRKNKKKKHLVQGGTNEIISFETCCIPILRTFSLLLESVFVLVWISCKCAWKSSFVIYILLLFLNESYAFEF